MNYENSSLIKIDNNSFSAETGAASQLQSVYLPNSVLWIGAKAFYDCRKLVNITLGDKLVWIGDNAFSVDGLSTGTLAIENLPDSVQHIGDNAFYCQKNIKLTKLPAALETIGAAAFRGGLSKVMVTEFGGNLKSIGRYAFCDAGSAFEGDNTITIRAVVENIGEYAFGYLGVSNYIYQYGKGKIKHVLIERESYDSPLGFYDSGTEVIYG